MNSQPTRGLLCCWGWSACASPSSDTVQGVQMWAAKLLSVKDFSAPAKQCTVAKTLILASRIIVTSLMPLIKVSSRHYLGTKTAFVGKWHRGRNKEILSFLKMEDTRRNYMVYTDGISHLMLYDIMASTTPALLFLLLPFGLGSAGLADLCFFWSTGWFPLPLWHAQQLAAGLGSPLHGSLARYPGLLHCVNNFTTA